MRLSVMQENLAKGLSIVGRAVSSRSTLPVLSNILLSTDEERLKLALWASSEQYWDFDLDTGVMRRMWVDTPTRGSELQVATFTDRQHRIHPDDLPTVQARLRAHLRGETELFLYVQLSSAAEVEVTRRAVEAAGFYGSRIFVEQGPRDHLHLADNLADGLVAVGDAAAMPEAEALRVLRPEAVALLGAKRIVKPVPAGMDDWSHPYHGPDNNPLSRDQIARGPYLTHFLADPRYAPLPQVAVASGGRAITGFRATRPWPPRPPVPSHRSGPARSRSAPGPRAG